MPIFEYTCTNCGHRFETLVLGNTEIKCPSCGSIKLKKQFSTFAVHNGPTKSSRSEFLGAERPCCSSSCGSGFEQGTCGSGMCCGG